MCSDTAGAALSVPIAHRRQTVSVFSMPQQITWGSFAEIVKDVDLLF